MYTEHHEMKALPRKKKLLTYLYLNYFCHINNEVVKVERVDY